jgi:hypothetical protein
MKINAAINRCDNQIIYLVLCGLLFLPLVFWPLESLAAVYKWQDDNGIVHYTEYPPEGRASEMITTNHKAPSQPYVPGAQADDPKTPATPSATPEKQAEDKKYCEIARKNLETLQQHPRIRKQDKDGNYYYLDEGQKQAEVNTATKGVADYCK